MTYPFGSWVMIDRLPDEPIVAFVYLDAHAGPSAKGGLASERDLARMPSRTIRLVPETALRELSPEEIAAYYLPAAPDWLRSYGPQPAPQSPWHRDPLLAGKFHAQYPDDIQALVHDGDPRRTRRGPELCWIRMQRIERAPTRQVAAAASPAKAGRAAPPEAVRSAIEPSRHVYVAELLNQPHTLSSVQRGDRIKVISVHGLPHPLHVTEDYLREREEWTITPCDKCGASECFDPPSVMAAVRFPEAPPDSIIEAFTSFCSHCGGIQQLRRRPD